MTNHWIDIKNSDAILIMGSNAAEHHPVSFKWIMRAKDAGAALMHVDPKFSRTSARCDFHVPIRSGTDIAFLGGMINYIIESGSWFRDYIYFPLGYLLWQSAYSTLISCIFGLVTFISFEKFIVIICSNMMATLFFF